MSLHDQDDLMPRPLPKPSQVEVVSVLPEVPEPSLIFDKSSQLKYTFTNNYHSTVSSLPSSRNLFVPNSDNIATNQRKNSASPTPMRSYPSTDSYNFVDQSNTRKVSFSPHLNNFQESLKPSNQFTQSEGCCKYSNNTKTPSCRCRELKSESPNDLRHHFSPPCADFARKTYQISHDCEHSMPNDTYSKKLCSCAGCMKEYFEGSYNSVTEEPKSNFISIEELQKTVLKFENLFLKLNYKISKNTENFVSKEELNTIIRGYEARINSMQEVLDTLVTRNKISYCDGCNLSNQQRNARTPAKNEAIPRFNSVRVEESETVNSYNTVPQFNQLTNTGAFCVNSKLETERNDRRRLSCESPNHQNAVPKDQSGHPLSPFNTRFGSGKTSLDSNMFQARGPTSQDDRSKNIRNYQDHSDPVLPDNRSLSKPTESNRNQDYGKEMNIANLNDNKQLKQICESVVTHVKNQLLEKQGSVNVKEITDPTLFIREATIEHLRNMGLNVKNIFDDDKLSQCENDEAKRVTKSNTNVAAPSSDLSLHMNSLAMKYISNFKKDENEFVEKKSAGNDLSCNNVSIATLRYLERHQILSELDKPVCHGTNEPASSAQIFKMVQSYQNNDRSFIQ